MKLLLASTNQGKIQEIRSILSELHWEGRLELETLAPGILEPDEPFSDFMENAIHKARYYSFDQNMATIADDSGLCIETLKGFPGVKTKDWIQECGGLSQAFSSLEAMLADQGEAGAYFQTALAVFFPQTQALVTHEERHYGSMTFPARGREGFGFDPIFIPEGYTQTMAELGMEVKAQISHRAKALRGLLGKLKEYLPD